MKISEKGMQALIICSALFMQLGAGFVHLCQQRPRGAGRLKAMHIIFQAESIKLAFFSTKNQAALVGNVQRLMGGNNPAVCVHRLYRQQRRKPKMRAVCSVHQKGNIFFMA